jgi:hypothetical protein
MQNSSQVANLYYLQGSGESQVYRVPEWTSVWTLRVAAETAGMRSSTPVIMCTTRLQNEEIKVVPNAIMPERRHAQWP